MTETSLDMALLECTANDAPLNDGQLAFVRELATSGARCQVGLAPAGTGKTTALQALTRAWGEDGGAVVAFAPSAAAARLLGEATGTAADTLAKGVQLLAAGELCLDDRALVVVDDRAWRLRVTSRGWSSGRSTRARACDWSATTGSSPPSAQAGCCATSPRRPARRP